MVCNYFQLLSKRPQVMFKNVPHAKTKCGYNNASETFVER